MNGEPWVCVGMPRRPQAREYSCGRSKPFPAGFRLFAGTWAPELRYASTSGVAQFFMCVLEVGKML